MKTMPTPVRLSFLAPSGTVHAQAFRCFLVFPLEVRYEVYFEALRKLSGIRKVLGVVPERLEEIVGQRMLSMQGLRRHYMM